MSKDTNETAGNKMADSEEDLLKDFGMELSEDELDEIFRDYEDDSNESVQENIDETEETAEEFSPLPEDVLDDSPITQQLEDIMREVTEVPEKEKKETLSEENIDLSNHSDADLMSILAEDEELSDIGELLSGEPVADTEEANVFDNFAENEMAAQSLEGEKKEEEDKKKEKKGGFLGAISNFFKMLLADEEEENPVEMKITTITPEELSDENAKILESFRDLDESAKEEKPKKEKKPKEKKEKKPKPKKEKKPKEPDNTPPLPKGPVIVIWAMAASLFIFVMVSVNLSGYDSFASKARHYFDNGQYSEAYAEFLGLEVKDKDIILYNQAATLAAVDSELNAFYSFLSAKRQEEAFDSLICAAGRCELNSDNAQMYECEGQMEILKDEISNNLYTHYEMSYEEAVALYNVGDRDEYTEVLTQKLRNMGLTE